MEDEYFSIGDVAHITGIPKDTLNFYINSGLLEPHHVAANGYRYFAHKNLWQLDIISAFRKLKVPLDQVAEILAQHDNDRVTELLAQHRSKALALSEYYARVAQDIDWYEEENKRISDLRGKRELKLIELEERLVVAGRLHGKTSNYHAAFIEASKKELAHTDSIRRTYGYVLDRDAVREGRYEKTREYMHLEGGYPHSDPGNLMIIPAGTYLTGVLHIVDNRANFSPMVAWAKENGFRIEAAYAEELGLQLFHYNMDYHCEIRMRLVEDKA